MLRGYADEHVKSAIVEGVRRHGMDVVTVQERGQGEANDEVLLAAATAEGRLMLSNDVDFLRIHAEWLANRRGHAGIVYWPQVLGIGVAVRRLVQYALTTPPEEAANRVKFL
jgi:hypothetical protein